MKRLAPLYGRTPMGEGTPWTESLTSFVGRLARARHLTSTAVFDGLVRPRVPEGMMRKPARLSRFLASGAVVYDGLGRHAEALVGAVSSLTGLENLSSHTLLPWRPLLSGKRNGALRYGQKRWCAPCLAEWRAEGLELWEPLLWRIALVNRCPVHRAPFSEVCPKCQAPQGLLVQTVPFGTCRSCKHGLEAGAKRFPAGPAPELESEAARREWWIAVEVGRLLAFQSAVSSFASSDNFSMMLKGYASRVNHGSTRNLVRFLGADRLTVVNWLHGRSLPTLDSFLRACLRLGADPLQVAIFPHMPPPRSCHYPRDKAPASWPPFSRGTRGSSCGPHGPAFWSKVTEALSGMLADPKTAHLSATQTAKALGIRTETLRRRYPREFSRIQERYGNYLQGERRRAFRERCRRIREAVRDCVHEEVYPSQEGVFRRARVSRTFQSLPEYKEAWFSALQEQGITPR